MRMPPERCVILDYHYFNLIPPLSFFFPQTFFISTSLQPRWQTPLGRADIFMPGKHKMGMNLMTGKHLCVAIYLTHTQADEALARIQHAGFGTEHLSFAGKDTWVNAVGSYATGNRARYCGPLGIFWEKLWKLLLERGVFCSDSTGPLLIAGPLVGLIVTAHDQDLTNGNEFELALSAMSIPVESITQYTKALKINQILLFYTGSLDEVNRTRDILNDTKAINHTLHHGAGDHLSLNITGSNGRPLGSA